MTRLGRLLAGLFVASLVTVGCAGGTLLPEHRTYVKPDGTEEQREADFSECSSGWRAARRHMGLIGITVESEYRDCMATKGYQKSQQGMVPANAMDALTPLPPSR